MRPLAPLAFFPRSHATIRVALLTLLCAAYALPLFWPPPARLPEWHADAPLLTRLFPTVPAWWVTIRLTALLLGTLAFVRWCGAAFPEFPPASQACPSPSRWQHSAAVCTSAMLLALAPWMPRANPLGVAAYLGALFLPAMFVAVASARTRPTGVQSTFCRRLWLPVLAVTAVWAGGFVFCELGNLEPTRTVDHWRAFVAALRFTAGDGNLLSDLYDAELPHLGALPFALQGVLSWQLGLAQPSLAGVQSSQAFWTAATAIALGGLVGAYLGAMPAVFAAAAFLSSPFTHHSVIAPAPFVFAPLLTVALLHSWHRFRVQRSAAALVAAGPLAGLALHYPSLIPLVGLLGLSFLAGLSSTWGTLRWAWLVGALGFLAAVVPSTPVLFSFEETRHLLRFHGNAAWLDLALLGQAPVRLMEEARAVDVRRTTDIVLGALLSPWAHSRLHIRIWGDTVFDPLTSIGFAFGLIQCLRAIHRSFLARGLLALWLTTLLPSFVSPVDRVDLVHSAHLPVAVSVVSALGFAQTLQWVSARLRVALGTAAILTVLVSGSALVHQINPRILSASATGLALESIEPRDRDRAVVLDYPARFHVDVRWLYVGPMTAYAVGKPVGYLRLEEGTVPVPQLLADGKDVVFWSPGLQEDFHISATLCELAPRARLFRIVDSAHLGSVWAAQLSGDWEPRVPFSRWRDVPCSDAAQLHSLR